MKLAWQLTKAQREGMMIKKFIRYSLTLLGLGKKVNTLFRGGRERPIASLAELLSRFLDLASLPEFQDALADP